MPLLKTKFFTPSIRPELVSRSRLLKKLNEGLCRKLTLLSAPAGYGKTTLLSEWVAQASIQVAWLSLDDEDNDPGRFWTYVIAALQTQNSQLGSGDLKLLQIPQRASIQTLLNPLFNEIADLPGQVALVLDDYHLIADKAIHEGLTFWLDHQPGNLHLIIASRADPPLPTFRLRARGQLAELRADDLRFNIDEATAFLHAMDIDLAREDVAALEGRTEGWAAGLHLAGLSLQGRPDAREFIAAFTGSHHYVLAYLTEEVVRRQPQTVQRFMMQTSILHRLSAPLCDAVTGGNDAEAMLDSLHRDNLFVIPLDDERRWYRYHHLFADLLGNLLHKNTDTAHIQELHSRASLWHEQHGLAGDAVKYALQAKDFERAAALIEQAARSTISHGKLTQFARWLDALPEDVQQRYPRLRVYRAWTLSLGGHSHSAHKMLQDLSHEIRGLPPTPDNLALRGEVAALLVSTATAHQAPTAIIQQAEEALSYLPETDVVSHARVRMALGTAYAYSDELDKAVETFRQANALARKIGNRFLAAAAAEMLAGLHIYHLGALREGARVMQAVLDSGLAEDGSPLPFAATAHALLAEVHLEWNDLAPAAAQLEKGFALAQQGNIGYSLMYIHCIQARLKQAQGDANGAVQALQAGEQALSLHPLWHFVVHQASCQVRLGLWLDDIDMAARWVSDGPDTTKYSLPERLPAYLREVQQVSAARVYLAQGKPGEALAVCERLYAPAHEAGRMARVIELCLLKALALQALGQSKAAFEAFEVCLSLAEPEGYVRLFIEAGEPVVPLLAQAAPHSTYAAELLVAFDQPGTGQIPEPLTPRELEVLRLICEGHSNRAIAENLSVSLSTVKKHTGNVYGKLQVSSRTQAIVRAQALRLV